MVTIQALEALPHKFDFRDLLHQDSRFFAYIQQIVVSILVTRQAAYSGKRF